MNARVRQAWEVVASTPNPVVGEDWNNPIQLEHVVPTGSATFEGCRAVAALHGVLSGVPCIGRLRWCYSNYDLQGLAQ